MTKNTITKRIAKWEKILDALMDAYESIAVGGAQSYMIDDRQVTKLDLPVIKKEIEDAERKIEALNAELNGQPQRRAFCIIPVE